MRWGLFICVMWASFANAQEAPFLGTGIVSLGSTSILNQPAGLAWLPDDWSFSGSGSALENQTTEFNGDSQTSYQTDQSPLTFSPLFVATGTTT